MIKYTDEMEKATVPLHFPLLNLYIKSQRCTGENINIQLFIAILSLFFFLSLGNYIQLKS